MADDGFPKDVSDLAMWQPVYIMLYTCKIPVSCTIEYQASAFERRLDGKVRCVCSEHGGRAPVSPVRRRRGWQAVASRPLAPLAQRSSPSGAHLRYTLFLPCGLLQMIVREACCQSISIGFCPCAA